MQTNMEKGASLLRLSKRVVLEITGIMNELQGILYRYNETGEINTQLEELTQMLQERQQELDDLNTAMDLIQSSLVPSP